MPDSAPEELPQHDEDDHDLLTFNESAIRLREEIAALEAEIAATGAPASDKAAERLAALRLALERNSRHEESMPGEAGFLAFDPGRSKD